MAEKQKKAGSKINAFDILVILLVLCLIGTVAYRVYEGVAKDKVDSTSKYVIEFECDDYDSLARYLAVGDEVYLSSNGALLGEIYRGRTDFQAIFVETEAEETTVSEETTDSTLIGGSDEEETEAGVSYKPAKIKGKIRLNVSVTASREGSYYTLGEINFSKGSVINVYTEDTEFTITITNITTVK